MYFEDFSVGQEFKTNSRTITPTDVEMFTSLSWAVNPIFLNDQYARERGFPSRVVPGALVIAYAIGLLYQTSIFDHIIALAGIDKLVFKSPTHPGETIWAMARVTDKRESKSRDRGVVRLFVECLKGPGDSVSFEAEMVFIMLRKPLNP